MGLTNFPNFSDILARRNGGENWPYTTATVFSRMRFEDRKGGAITRITFTYWVDGQVEQGEFDATSPETDFNEGETFEVHYDPTCPSRHYFAPAAEGSAKVARAIAIFLVVFVCLILFGFLESRR